MSFIKDLQEELREATGLAPGDLARGATRGLGRALQGDDADRPPVQVVIRDREEKADDLPSWALPVGLGVAALALILAVRK